MKRLVQWFRFSRLERWLFFTSLLPVALLMFPLTEELWRRIEAHRLEL